MPSIPYWEPTPQASLALSKQIQPVLDFPANAESTEYKCLFGKSLRKGRNKPWLKRTRLPHICETSHSLPSPTASEPFIATVTSHLQILGFIDTPWALKYITHTALKGREWRHRLCVCVCVCVCVCARARVHVHVCLCSPKPGGKGLFLDYELCLCLWWGSCTGHSSKESECAVEVGTKKVYQDIFRCRFLPRHSKVVWTMTTSIS